MDIKNIASLDLYGILNCTKNSSIQEISNQYKKLIRHYHPDKRRNSLEVDVASKIEEIQLAYRVLSDNEIRSEYDKLRNAYLENLSQHYDLKASYTQFMENGGNTRIVDKSFAQINDELNKKHNYNELLNSKLQDPSKLLSKKMAERNSFKPPYEKMNFESSKDFNSHFNTYKCDNISTDLIPYEDINTLTLSYGRQKGSAFTDLTLANDLYIEDGSIESDKYSSINEAFNLIQVNESLLRDSDKTLKQRLEDYKTESKRLHNLSMSEYSTDRNKFTFLPENH